MAYTKKYSPTYRILHWSIAIIMSLLLGTILLRLTWLNKANVAAIIGEYLAGTGQSLSQEQLTELAKKIREPMWIWHTYLGYLLTGLFSVRMILPVFGSMKLQNPLEKELVAREKLKKWTYIIFYLLIAVSLVTGLIIVWGPREYKQAMESVHILGIYYLIGFMLLHFAGIFIAEMTHEKGIISRIINGSAD